MAGLLLALVATMAAVLAVPGVSDTVYSFFAPPPVLPAADDETLIVVAAFHETTEIRSEPHTKIRRAIAEAAAETGLDKFRVEEEPTILEADEREEAEALGQRYNAAMIIWGEDTGVQVIVNFLNLKQPDYTAAEVQIEENERVQLTNPDAYTQFIVEELPDQLTFLTLFAVGQSYSINDKHKLALTTFETAITTLPLETQLAGLAEAYFQVGWLYQAPFTNRVQAIENYDQVIALDPQYAAAFNNRGLVYAEQGDLEKAIADFDQAIALDPQDAVAFNNLCWWGTLAGHAAEAIESCEQGVHLVPNYGGFYDSRGLARALTGDRQGAIEDFKIFVAWSKENDLYEPYGLKREAWIADLEAGRNPFDQETLDALKQE